MNKVRIIRPQTGPSLAEAQAMFDLMSRVWPPDGSQEPSEPGAVFAAWRAQSSTHFVIGEDETDGKTDGALKFWAHALIFRREIFTIQGPLVVGALAGVCVHPDYRGRGWGAAVARAAVEALPELGVEVSLFQTGVSGFYEKLGGRIVTNRFFNGDNPNNPFWDTCQMIYPASFLWPDGDIDLNGEGY